MDAGKSFTYVFEDKDWIVKILIGGGILLLGALFSWLLLIPLIAAGAVLVGYYLKVVRNVYDGSPNPLPEWTDIGGLFSKGIGAIIGLFIWSIPVLVLSCCAYLPLIFLNGDRDNGASGIFGLFTFCFACLAAIVGIATALFTYAPLTNYALNGQMSTFWDFQGNWKFIQANPGNYLMAFLLTIVAGIIAAVAGSITCGLLSTFTGFWGYLVAAHLFGQVARANASPTDTTMLPPTPPMEPPSMMDGPFEPAPSA